MRRSLLAFSCCAGLVLVQVAAAQTVPSLQKGALVRIVVPARIGSPEQRVTGTLIRLQDDTVIIERGGGGAALPESSTVALGQGDSLEFLRRRHSYGGTGALLGALVGGALGAATGGSGQSTNFGRQAGTAGGAILGAGAGALLGLVIGSSLHGDTWVPVQTTGVRVAVTPGGVGITLSW